MNRIFRRFTSFIAILLICQFIPLAELFANEADSIVGEWYTENNKSVVKIYKVGNKYYGKIIWLKAPNDKNGKPKLDKNNEDEKLQKRPLLNLVILKDFEYDEDNEWDDGEIYNPEDGETYSCTMTLIDKNTLEVRGYVGISLLGKSQTWKRKR